MIKLFPYQEDGANFLAHGPRFSSLIADEPGLGKTLQVASAIARGSISSALILCPAVAVHVWVREMQKLIPNWKPIIASPAMPFFPPDCTVICSYNMMTQHPTLRAAFTARDWDVLVTDEGHYLRKVESMRTVHVLSEIRQRCNMWWNVTGTPMPKDVMDLWPSLYCAGVTELGYEDFRYTFADGYQGRYDYVITGIKNVEQLRDSMKGYYIRRKTEDVLPELPKLIVDTIQIPLTANPKLPTGVELPDFDDMEGDEHIATLRRALGFAKVKGVMDLCEDTAYSGHKTLVFAWHRDVLSALVSDAANRNLNPVWINGHTPPLQRAEREQAFQNDPSCKIFIGQIQAAGTALTLTAANQVFVVEPDWLPEVNFQAIKRAHRIGTKDRVLARFVVGDNEVDQRIMKTLARRTRDIRSVWDDV